MESTLCGRKTRHSRVVQQPPLPLLLHPSQQEMESTKLCLLRLTFHSPTFNPSTLLLPSMSPRMSGKSLRESRPRPLDLPSSRLLLALLNLITFHSPTFNP